jgi:hypothetical protein
LQVTYLSLLPMWSLSLSFPVRRDILPVFSSCSVGEVGSACAGALLDSVWWLETSAGWPIEWLAVSNDGISQCSRTLDGAIIRMLGGLSVVANHLGMRILGLGVVDRVLSTCGSAFVEDFLDRAADLWLRMRRQV